MKIYQGNYLEVVYEKSKKRFVQNWVISPITIEDFKHEMLTYTSLYKTHRPVQSMWLQQNFHLELDVETQKWIEQHINIPCKEAGNKQLAFVLGADVLAHLQVIGAFEKIQSCIIPKHFATEAEARNWLESFDVPIRIGDDDMKVTYKGTGESGDAVFEVKVKSSSAVDVVKNFESFMEESIFIKNNIQKFLLLTEREKEVLVERANGTSLQEISQSLNISLFTGRTHWRNIKKKLAIESTIDAAKYVKAFK